MKKMRKSVLEGIKAIETGERLECEGGVHLISGTPGRALKAMLKAMCEEQSQWSFGVSHSL